jgi:hypothetical protein
MKVAPILIASLVPFAVGGGCAVVQMYRNVTVETTRLQAESGMSNGLTPTLAVDLFRDVANQLGFVMEGPKQVSGTRFEYSADAPGKRPIDKTSLIIDVDDKRIRFSSSIYGTTKEFFTAQRAAALFEQKLDARGIRYKVREGIAFPPP